MRTLDELINTEDPALPLVQAWAEQSGLPCDILSPSAQADQVLLGLQVTTRSPLGAIAHGTGGILVDSGWLRLLGSGHPRLSRDLGSWNQGRADRFLLVADDVVGGFFAINGGGLGEDPGTMYYLAPDTMTWEPMGMGFSQFVQWAFSDRLGAFYAPLRWAGWKAELQQVGGDQCFHFHPPLWTAEGSVLHSSRRPVPAAELYAMSLPR